MAVGADLAAGGGLYFLLFFGSQASSTAFGTDPNRNPIRTLGGFGQAKGPVLTLTPAQAADPADL